MSDKPNPGKQTSPAAEHSALEAAETFDARLKRLDEPRWLASRYAPSEARERLAAVCLFDLELRRALAASEPMLGKIRLQWWREALAEISTWLEDRSARLRRHDLTQELARVLQGRPDVVAALSALVDAVDDILDDHLHAGGHDGGAQHAARHLAVGAAQARAAGRALDAAASEADLARLAAVAEADIALKGEMPGAAERFAAAAREARAVSPTLWPAILHLAVRGEAGPLAMRLRVFAAMLTRKL